MRKLSLPDISAGEKHENFVEITISADAPSERSLNFALADVHLYKHCVVNGRSYPIGVTSGQTNSVQRYGQWKGRDDVRF